MTFGTQLRLLLWKNFKLRQRQKFRTLTELFWPLFLFLILAWVRTRPLTREYYPCNFYSRPLQTAGFVPFVQTFICLMQNHHFCDFHEDADSDLSVSGDHLKHMNLEYRSLFAFLSRLYNRTVDNPQGSFADWLKNIDRTLRLVDEIEPVENVDGTAMFGSWFIDDNEAAKRLENRMNISKADAKSLMGMVMRPNFMMMPIGFAIKNKVKLPEKMDIWTLLSLAIEYPPGVAETFDDIRSVIFCNVTLLKNLTVNLTNAQKIGDSVCNSKKNLVDFFYHEAARSQMNKVVVLQSYLRALQNVTGLMITLPLAEEVVADIRSLRAFWDAGPGPVLNDMADSYELYRNESREDDVGGNGTEPVSLMDFFTCDTRLRTPTVPPGMQNMGFKVNLTRMTKRPNDFMGKDLPSDGEDEVTESGRYNRSVSPLLMNSTGGLEAGGGDYNATLGQSGDHDGVPGRNITKICGGFPVDRDKHNRCRNALPMLIPGRILAILRGYVLFSPDTPAVQALVRKMNLWLNGIAAIRDTLKWYGDNVEEMGPLVFNSTLGGAVKRFVDMGKRLAVPVPEIAEYVDLLGTLLVDMENASMGMEIKEGLERVYSLLDCFETNRLAVVQDEAVAVHLATCLEDYTYFYTAIVFEDLDAAAERFPPLVKYKIRMEPSMTDGTRRIMDQVWSGGPRGRAFIDLKYVYYGFVYFQEAVDRYIIEHHANRSVPIGSFIQQYPVTCYYLDRFITAVAGTIPLFMVVAWIYTAAMIVKSIVLEKEQRLKEVMKVMGLTNFVHWLAWFIHCFVMMMISVFMVVALLKLGRITKAIDPSLLIVYMMCFAVATIAKCFFISTLFAKANLAAACGGILYFLVYLPYPPMFRLNYEFMLPFRFKLASCLISNVAFGWGCSYIAVWEQDGRGLQWGNLWESPSLGDNFAFVHPLYMLLIDAVLYLCLTWYIEAVFPGEYGIPLPWYFPFTRSYWTGHGYMFDKTMSVDPEEEFAKQGSGNNIEPEPTGLKLGVSVRNLRKVYSNGKVAVNGLSLNFYENQITSFLGHNGAGKTTTLSLLTGLYPPTSGSARIYDHDIRWEINEVRKDLGMCPQHNVLFELLTVEEQLWFYAGLKGVKSSEIKFEVEKMLQDVGLPGKRDALAKTLSGGMQRKLSIAVSLIGNSKTVILDEPTAGVDPFARRGIWDLLLKHKQGRTIILSTHHMDEADVLGDRIAIISSGQLISCGSSLFLKKRYGSGYCLTLVRSVGSSMDRINRSSDTNLTVIPAAPPASHGSRLKLPPLKRGISRSDEQLHVTSSASTESSNTLTRNGSSLAVPIFSGPLLEFIQFYVPGATLLDEHGTEVTVALPTRDLRVLTVLFGHLDGKYRELGFSSYGVSDTTLEEVFLKVVGGEYDPNADEEHWGCDCFQIRRKFKQAFDKRKKKKEIVRKETNNLVDSDEECEDGEPAQARSRPRGRVRPDPNASKCWLYRQQFKALIIKRFQNFRRSLKGAFAEILLPSLFVAIAMLITSTSSDTTDMPALELVPWLYTAPIYIFHSHNEGGMFLANPPGVRGPTIGQQAVEALMEPPGVGVRCMDGAPLGKKYKCHRKGEFGRTPPSSSIALSMGQRWRSEVLRDRAGNCSCDLGVYKCDFEPLVEGPPPIVHTDTTAYMVNLTLHNITGWILTTEKKYSRHRYGGFNVPGIHPGALGQHGSELLARLPANYWALLNFSKNTLGLGPILADSASLDDDGTAVKRYVLSRSTDVTRSAVIDSTPGLRTSQFLLSGMEIQDNVKTWYDNRGWTSLPTYLNVLNNGVLRANLPPGLDPRQYGIMVANHPMDYSAVMKQELVTPNYVSEVTRSVTIILAFSFVPASFVLFLIDERVSNSKHLQFVSGVQPWLYWCANFCWDMLNFLIPVMACFVIFALFNQESYLASPLIVLGVLLLFLLYGYAVIPFMYPFSRLFEVPSVAMISLASMNLFIGLVTTLSTTILQQLEKEDEELAMINGILVKVFLLFPQYCLGRGLMDLKVEWFKYKFGLVQDSPNPFSPELFGYNLVCMFAVGTVCFIFVLLIEYKFFCCNSTFRRKDKLADGESERIEEDEDVADERRLVASGLVADTSILTVNDLTKVYRSGTILNNGSKNIRAVNRLCVAVPPGQCFGLLGINGAGKSTTFKMLTGKTSVTAGDAFFNGASILTDLNRACSSVGYCPQFDALNPLLTGREQLMFYARIRGIPTESLKSVVDWAIRHMQLSQYAERTTHTYSGGNKRKLSTAIALIGEPNVILLDEPTTGMDPKARRFLWNRIIEVVRDGRSVVLTSHSMEECEALCGRIAIMVNGSFKCLGSVQHLKSRFGEGYTLNIKLGGINPKLAELCQFIETQFPGGLLKEHHHNMVCYQLPPQSVSVASIFEALEDSRMRFDVEDTSVAQTTLDQVFISFAQQQKEKIEINKNAPCLSSCCCRPDRPPSRTPSDDVPLNDQSIGVAGDHRDAAARKHLAPSEVNEFRTPQPHGNPRFEPAGVDRLDGGASKRFKPNYANLAVKGDGSLLPHTVMPPEDLDPNSGAESDRSSPPCDPKPSTPSPPLDDGIDGGSNCSPSRSGVGSISSSRTQTNQNELATGLITSPGRDQPADGRDTEDPILVRNRHNHGSNVSTPRTPLGTSDPRGSSGVTQTDSVFVIASPTRSIPDPAQFVENFHDGAGSFSDSRVRPSDIPHLPTVGDPLKRNSFSGHSSPIPTEALLTYSPTSYEDNNSENKSTSRIQDHNLPITEHRNQNSPATSASLLHGLPPADGSAKGATYSSHPFVANVGIGFSPAPSVGEQSSPSVGSYKSATSGLVGLDDTFETARTPGSVTNGPPLAGIARVETD